MVRPVCTCSIFVRDVFSAVVAIIPRHRWHRICGELLDDFSAAALSRRRRPPGFTQRDTAQHRDRQCDRRSREALVEAAGAAQASKSRHSVRGFRAKVARAGAAHRRTKLGRQARLEADVRSSALRRCAIHSRAGEQPRSAWSVLISATAAARPWSPPALCIRRQRRAEKRLPALQYRRHITAGDDYAAMEQAIRRRYTRLDERGGQAARYPA